MKKTAVLWLGGFILFLGFALTMPKANLSPDILVPPSLAHPFGTDFLGRDLFLRSIDSLRVSIWVGLFASLCGVLLGGWIGIWAAVFDQKILGWLLRSVIDLFIGLPHLVTGVVLSSILGGGLKGIVVAVALTHFASVARLFYLETRRIILSEYYALAVRQGVGRYRLFRAYLVPPLMRAGLVYVVLTFPHAILHEASLSFLGVGFAPHQPSMGVLLSESIRYLSAGQWWMGVLPGGMLGLLVILFHHLGEWFKCFYTPDQFAANELGQ